MDRNSDLERKLKNVQSVEHLACVNLVVALARATTLKTHVKTSVAKNSQNVEEIAQVKEDFRMWITSLRSLLETERDRLVCFKKNHVDEYAGSQDVSAEQQKAHNALVSAEGR